MVRGLYLLAAVVTISCSQQAGNDSEAVREMIRSLIKADNQADIDKVLSYYSKTAVLVPPGKPDIAGQAAIRVNYENIFAASKLDLRVRIDSVMVSGQRAVSYGTTFGNVTLLTDETVRKVNDKFTMVLELEDQQWKITRLMWTPQ